MKQYAADDAAAGQVGGAARPTRPRRGAERRGPAKRCADARTRYQAVMSSYRLYEQGPDGERRYLDSAEIDAARADAKKVMDEFCGGQ